MLKHIATAVTAIALLAAPVAAAEPVSGARALSVSGSMRESSDLSGGLSAGWIFGAIFVAAVIGLLVFGGDDEEDMPVSP